MTPPVRAYDTNASDAAVKKQRTCNTFAMLMTPVSSPAIRSCRGQSTVVTRCSAVLLRECLQSADSRQCGRDMWAPWPRTAPGAAAWCDMGPAGAALPAGTLSASWAPQRGAVLASKAQTADLQDGSRCWTAGGVPASGGHVCEPLWTGMDPLCMCAAPGHPSHMESPPLGWSHLKRLRLHSQKPPVAPESSLVPPSLEVRLAGEARPPQAKRAPELTRM